MDQSNNFPAPGTILWGIDVALDRDVFRKGKSSAPNTDFLRYSDIGIDESPDGQTRISPENAQKYFVDEDDGISLFLTKAPGARFRVLSEADRKTAPKEGQEKRHWWAIEQGHPLPTGLVLKYDGNPPGHCTLTVTRSMSVAAFLELVKLVPFVPAGVDVIAPAL